MMFRKIIITIGLLATFWLGSRSALFLSSANPAIAKLIFRAISYDFTSHLPTIQAISKNLDNKDQLSDYFSSLSNEDYSSAWRKLHPDYIDSQKLTFEEFSTFWRQKRTKIEILKVIRSEKDSVEVLAKWDLWEANGRPVFINRLTIFRLSPSEGELKIDKVFNAGRDRPQ